MVLQGSQRRLKSPSQQRALVLRPNEVGFSCEIAIWERCQAGAPQSGSLLSTRLSSIDFQTSMSDREGLLVLRPHEVGVGCEVSICERRQAGGAPQRIRIAQVPPLLAHAAGRRQRGDRQQREDLQQQLIRQQRLDRRQRL